MHGRKMPAASCLTRDYFHLEMKSEDLEIPGMSEPESDLSTTTDSEYFAAEVLATSTDEEWMTAPDGTEYEIHAEEMEDTTRAKIPSEFVQPGEAPRIRRIDSTGMSYLASIQSSNAPDEVYVTLHRDRSEKERLEVVINDMYTSKLYGITTSNLLVPGLLVVICSAEQQWYRAEILSTVDSKGSGISLEVFNVLLIDEGIKCQVPIYLIRYMKRILLSYHIVTHKCEINLHGGFPWSDTALLRFREIVIPGIRIELKYLRTHESDPKTWIVNFKLHVAGYCSHDIRYVDIVKEMQSIERRCSILAIYQPLSDTEEEFSEYF